MNKFAIIQIVVKNQDFVSTSFKTFTMFVQFAESSAK
jgi:hypothetical protein